MMHYTKALSIVCEVSLMKHRKEDVYKFNHSVKAESKNTPINVQVHLKLSQTYHLMVHESY